MSSGKVQGLEYEVGRRPGARCSVCRGEGSLLSPRGGGSDFAACETCAFLLHAAWRQVAGDAPPGYAGEELRRVHAVHVLLPRRRLVRSGGDPAGDLVRAAAELSSSYEFLLEERPDGTLAPPSAQVARGESAGTAALGAMALVGLGSWPSLVETLYVGYGPRGRLAAVVIPRGWFATDRAASESTCAWRPWRVSDHAGDASGYWRAVEDSAWRLRLHKLCNPADPAELSLQVREAARLYVNLRSDERAGKSPDTSMAAFYLSALSSEEVEVERLVRMADERAARERDLLVSKAGAAPAPAKSPEAGGAGSGTGSGVAAAGERGFVTPDGVLGGTRGRLPDWETPGPEGGK